MYVKAKETLKKKVSYTVKTLSHFISPPMLTERRHGFADRPTGPSPFHTHSLITYTHLPLYVTFVHL